MFTSVCNLLENSTKSPQRQNAMHFYWQKSRKPEAGQR
ncbi:TPA: DUF2554 family protein [Escherichia coli]|nr:DUF2554 family protein [Escherichia coli]